MNQKVDEDPELDELDKFMEQNEEKSKEEKKRKLITTLKEIEGQIAETQKLLKVVQPTFISDEQEIDKRLQQQETEKQESLKKQQQLRMEKEKERLQAKKTMQQIKDSKGKGDADPNPLKGNLSKAEEKELDKAHAMKEAEEVTPET
eukprot:CAMPEP_0176452636 /NCGR_PEP_ID=MMETSP0127-20121128/28666_1 /TAXON_ID=938130 /ORGANISM="Platyophrya macrostoma, Strain WH" /LENGTH=146 /DNA_ID=CAMNT_0017841153 /DNA_START=18 /DNA_END=455 /DNA_ORIENTATION=+